MTRAQWLDTFAPNLSKAELLELTPDEADLVEGNLNGLRQLRLLGRRDAGARLTPCMDRWHKRRDTRNLDALWVAACWEAAAGSSDDPDRRATCYMYSRAIIAHAKGQLVTLPAYLRRAA